MSWKLIIWNDCECECVTHVFNQRHTQVEKVIFGITYIYGSDFKKPNTASVIQTKEPLQVSPH